MPDNHAQEKTMTVAEVEAPSLAQQVFNVMQKLRQSGRLSTKLSLEQLEAYSTALLQNMLAGYTKQLEGSGRNQAV